MCSVVFSVKCNSLFFFQFDQDGTISRAFVLMLICLTLRWANFTPSFSLSLAAYEVFDDWRHSCRYSSEFAMISSIYFFSSWISKLDTSRIEISAVASLFYSSFFFLDVITNFTIFIRIIASSATDISYYNEMNHDVCVFVIVWELCRCFAWMLVLVL